MGQILSHGSDSKSCIMYIVYPVYTSVVKRSLVMGQILCHVSRMSCILYHTSYLLYPRMFLNVVELLIEKSSEEDFPSLC